METSSSGKSWPADYGLRSRNPSASGGTKNGHYVRQESDRDRRLLKVAAHKMWVMFILVENDMDRKQMFPMVQSILAAMLFGASASSGPPSAAFLGPLFGPS